MCKVTFLSVSRWIQTPRTVKTAATSLTVATPMPTKDWKPLNKLFVSDIGFKNLQFNHKCNAGDTGQMITVISCLLCHLLTLVSC